MRGTGFGKILRKFLITLVSTIMADAFAEIGFVINNSGSFFYSGTPALGNLIASIAGTGGTDGNGNVYYNGMCRYSPSGGAIATEISQLTAATLNLGPDGAITLASGASPAYISGDGPEGTLNIGAGLQSASDTTANLTLLSRAASQSPDVPLANLGAVLCLLTGQGTPSGPGPFLWAPSLGAIYGSSFAGIQGGIPVTQAIQSGLTQTSTSKDAMFTPFAIPKDDAQEYTTYRITCGGHGTQASDTSVPLNFELYAFGIEWAASVDTGGVAAGDNFHWRFQGELIIGAPGSTAPASFFGTMMISQATSSAQGHLTAMDQQNPSGVDTTAATNISFRAWWSSVAGSPAITCTGALFERLGP